jgi:GTP diphosphokinase / guanosine-3',5'-bis(diphosphate) 3'-diphosphatase
MASLERAIEIAAKAHAGQVDKAGQPYILHPIRVMLRVPDRESRIAAVLHDVVEDSEITFDALRAEGFSEEVLEALEALTKQPGESRTDAAHRARANPIAREVKLADNAENMDLSRISQPTKKDHARVVEYREVRAVLLGKSEA